jgi:hypothetical protein
LIAAAFGYLTMFGVTVACEVIALIVTLMYVNEPRKRRRVQH